MKLLTEEQILMLQLSDQNIQNGRLFSQDQIDKDDLLALNEQ